MAPASLHSTACVEHAEPGCALAICADCVENDGNWQFSKQCFQFAPIDKYDSARLALDPVGTSWGESARMQALGTRRTKQDAGENQMLRVIPLLLLGIFLVVPSAVRAGDLSGWHSFWHRAHVDTLRNKCWPTPFQEADRLTVCQTLSTQLAKGWKRQNTLSEVYFNSETQELNESGRRKLYAIMASSPSEFRTVYVVQSMNPDAQQRRVDSIQMASQQLFSDMPAPRVESVQIAPRSWSAEYIDEIGRRVNSTIPDPRLPSFTDTTGG